MQYKTKSEYLNAIKTTFEKMCVFNTDNDVYDWVSKNASRCKTYLELGKKLFDYVRYESSLLMYDFFKKLDLPFDYRKFIELVDIYPQGYLKECKSNKEFVDITLKYYKDNPNNFYRAMEYYDYELLLLANSDKVSSYYSELRAKYDALRKSCTPFNNNDEVRVYKYREWNNANYNYLRDKEAESDYLYNSIRGKLKTKVVESLVGVGKSIESIIGFIPSKLSKEAIEKYVDSKEEENYLWQKRYGRSYGLFFMLPEIVAFIGQQYFDFALGHILSFLKNCSDGLSNNRNLSLGEAALESLEEELYDSSKENSDNLVIRDTKRTLLIFDFDGTVFNTNSLRRARRNRQVSESDLIKVGYVEGFEDLFLTQSSSFYLGKYKVLGITSSYDWYCQTLLKTHPEFAKMVNCGVIRTSEKIKELTRFFKQHRNEYDEVIAFGDEEKDALIYSRLGLNYFIVNNYYGYEPKPDTILRAAANNKARNFRRRYLHDVKPLKYSSYKINYFDDVVIYYKNYLDTLRPDGKGSNNAPTQGYLKPLRIYKARNELGKYSKHDYILGHINEIASQFDDLPIDNNTVLVSIPGHSETSFDYNKPMFRLLKEIARRHNIKMIDDGVLYRKKVVEESKEGSRDIDKHIESISITNKGKQLIKGKNVYLFDDISTSGASMMACSALLHHFNAGHVVCFCIARTCGDGVYAPIEIK